MRTISAKDAKYNFGRLIDLARAAPIAITKYDRPVVVMMAVEEYDRLAGSSEGAPTLAPPTPPLQKPNRKPRP